MDKKVLGYIGFTSLFGTMLLTGLVDAERPSVSAMSSSLGTSTHEVVKKAHEPLASSTIFPALVPHTLPLPNLSDVAAEAVLGDTSEQVESKKESDTESDGSAQSSDNNIPMMGTFQAVKPALLHPDSKRFLSRVSAIKSLHTREFKTLLRPGGYKRPAWQDMSVNANLHNLADNNEPFLVVIDPGHGGSDPGSIGHNGLLEKDLTLDIARRVRLFLTEVDEIDVQLTRNHDYGLSRQSRVNSITRSEADLVISLHFNHLPQTDVNLVESFYAGPENIRESLAAQHDHQHGALLKTSTADIGVHADLSFTEGSAKLARDLQQRIFAEVSFENEHAQDAGVKQETLFVLTQSYTSGVLLEISCLSHVEEADRLTREEYRNRLSAALVDGIRNYYDALESAPIVLASNLGI